MQRFNRVLPSPSSIPLVQISFSPQPSLLYKSKMAADGFCFGSTEGGGGGGRGTGGSESPAFRTTFSRPPYFCAPLPPDSRPSLCCSRLQVTQEDQKPGFNFQTVPKLDMLVRFLAFVLAGGSLIPDKSYYRSVFLIKLSFTNRVITV